ncbi:hypothetical protein ISN44_As11g036430 [Arabidopsis suecica]|uniref:Uncharacterized protein n=1 Tax=Arabidopsis suecica TaxID=45249 RepID=A0A8T1ZHN8_ARASU|nr:hypothetical protein ISN44_As11g036430 [Arabidopsis suecica]
MSSSQFAIFCIILIALFPLYECVQREGLETIKKGEKQCIRTKCNDGSKGLCYCCTSITPMKCFFQEARCVQRCNWR